MLFGTNQVVGKRVAMVDFKPTREGKDVEVKGYHTIAGVVEDVLSDGGAYGGTGRETDWVVQFWPHFLVVSVVVYLLILAVVLASIALPAWNICRMKLVDALVN